MRDWYESLQERERVFVITAAVFLVIAIFYLAVWMPLAKGQKSMTSSVEMWSEQLAAVKPLIGTLQSQGGGIVPVVNGNQPLVVIVDSTVRKHQLLSALQRSTPTGDLIRVEFENAPFDNLVLWLGDLNQNYGLSVLTANFSNNSSQIKGRVNSTVTLER